MVSGIVTIMLLSVLCEDGEVGWPETVEDSGTLNIKTVSVKQKIFSNLLIFRFPPMLRMVVESPFMEISPSVLLFHGTVYSLMYIKFTI